MEYSTSQFTEDLFSLAIDHLRGIRIRTYPETAVQRSKSISVLIPSTVKVNDRVFTSLDDLMYEQQNALKQTRAA